MNCTTHSVQIVGRLAALPVVTLLASFQASVLDMVMLMVKRVVITTLSFLNRESKKMSSLSLSMPIVVVDYDVDESQLSIGASTAS